MSAFASSLLAVVASLRPSSTSYELPPNCNVTCHEQRVHTMLCHERTATTHRYDRVPRGDGQDISTRDYVSEACRVHDSFDVVYYFEPSQGIVIRSRRLLSDEGGGIIQQHRAIATLSPSSSPSGNNFFFFFFLIQYQKEDVVLRLRSSHGSAIGRGTHPSVAGARRPPPPLLGWWAVHAGTLHRRNRG